MKRHICGDGCYEAAYRALVDQRGGPDACWPWLGKTCNGYGVFHHGGTRKLAHVLALSMLGLLPSGKLALHRCNNRPCCNPGPGHLYSGTHLDNVLDAMAAGRRNPVRGAIALALEEVDSSAEDHWLDDRFGVSVRIGECGLCSGSGFESYLGCHRGGSPFLGHQIQSQPCSVCGGTGASLLNFRSAQAMAVAQ